MQFIGASYSSYAKDIQEIWCRSAKFLWKSKFYSGSGSGSRSWYYFGFQYQTYISYIEDTHQILFGSDNSFESYCVHMKSPRTYVHPDIQIDRQTDRQTEIFFGLFCLLRHKNHKHLSEGDKFFFFHSCDYNTFSDEKVKKRQKISCYSVDTIHLDMYIIHSHILRKFSLATLCVPYLVRNLL